MSNYRVLPSGGATDASGRNYFAVPERGPGGRARNKNTPDSNVFADGVSTLGGGKRHYPASAQADAAVGEAASQNRRQISQIEQMQNKRSKMEMEYSANPTRSNRGALAPKGHFDNGLGGVAEDFEEGKAVKLYGNTGEPIHRRRILDRNAASKCSADSDTATDGSGRSGSDNGQRNMREANARRTADLHSNPFEEGRYQVAKEPCDRMKNVGRLRNDTTEDFKYSMGAKKAGPYTGSYRVVPPYKVEEEE